MSDNLMGELEKMAEQQAAERLGGSEIEQMAEKFGLGNANDLLGKAEGMFGLGGHAPAAGRETEAPEREPAEEPAETEPQADSDNE